MFRSIYLKIFDISFSTVHKRIDLFLKRQCWCIVVQIYLEWPSLVRPRSLSYGFCIRVSSLWACFLISISLCVFCRSLPLTTMGFPKKVDGHLKSFPLMWGGYITSSMTRAGLSSTDHNEFSQYKTDTSSQYQMGCHFFCQIRRRNNYTTWRLIRIPTLALCPPQWTLFPWPRYIKEVNITKSYCTPMGESFFGQQWDFGIASGI